MPSEKERLLILLLRSVYVKGYVDGQGHKADMFWEDETISKIKECFCKSIPTVGDIERIIYNNKTALEAAQVKALKGRAVLCVTGNNVPKILVANKDIKLEIFQEVK